MRFRASLCCSVTPHRRHPTQVRAEWKLVWLALNLRRFIGAGELQPYAPQPRALNLLSCGEQRAIMAWGDWAAEGRWAWWWKDRIDRGFVRRFSASASGA